MNIISSYQNKSSYIQTTQAFPELVAQASEKPHSVASSSLYKAALVNNVQNGAFLMTPAQALAMATVAWLEVRRDKSTSYAEAMQAATTMVGRTLSPSHSRWNGPTILHQIFGENQYEPTWNPGINFREISSLANASRRLAEIDFWRVKGNQHWRNLGYSIPANGSVPRGLPVPQSYITRAEQDIMQLLAGLSNPATYQVASRSINDALCFRGNGERNIYFDEDETIKSNFIPQGIRIVGPQGNNPYESKMRIWNVTVET